MLDHSNLNICYLNARSLHKPIEDVRKDINYSSTDILIFTKTRFSPLEPNEMYSINCYSLFRNDISQYFGSGHPFGGTAICSRVLFVDGYPYAHNINEIEFTIIKTISHPNLTIIGLYHSPSIALSRLLSAL